MVSRACMGWPFRLMEMAGRFSLPIITLAKVTGLPLDDQGDDTPRAIEVRHIAAQLEAWSPARNVDSITIPVFLVQGSIDKRVPMDQFDALRKAFEARGVPVETMVAKGEGHGFYKPENRAELYRRMEAFLARHIGH